MFFTLKGRAYINMLADILLRSRFVTVDPFLQSQHGNNSDNAKKCAHQFAYMLGPEGKMKNSKYSIPLSIQHCQRTSVQHF